MSSIPSYKDHQLSSILPLMSQGEMWELENDIRVNGLRFPIMLLEDQILDGRNRYRACQKVGVDPKFVQFNGEGDPVDYIVSVNVKRRHLNTSQRALIAAKIANLDRGQPSEKKSAILPITSKTQQEASEELQVSPRSVRTAKEVLRTAPAKEIKAIERGEKTVATVARETKKKAEDKGIPQDKLGRAIPSDLVSEWQRAEAVGKRLRGLAREIKGTVEQGFVGAKQDKLKDLIYAEVGNSIITEAGALAYTLDAIIPYALCPTCQGRTSKNCTLCRKRGWISKFLWNSPAVNDDIKKLIGRT